MALGTPVTAAAAYSANGGTTVAPAYPAGILATDVVLLVVGQKPSTANGGTVTTPTGWTLREELTGAGGYGATLGADTGNTNLRIYSWNTPVAGQTGNLTVTIGTNNISWAFMIRIPTEGGTIVYGSADGSRTTAPTSGTPYTVLLTNSTPATNLKAGDVAIWAMCIPTDVLGGAGFSAHTISATGTTFGTPTELNEPSSGTGNDIGGYSAWVSATTGSSTAAPTIGATATGTVTNVRGPIALIRIRELPFIDAASTTFTYTGQDATLSVGRVIDAEAGSFSYTGQDAELIKTAAPKEINAEAGTFTYTGEDATLSRAYNINAEAGSFSYLGQDATLNRSYSFDAEAGTFSYTGQNAELLRSYSVNAEAGTFSYLGQDANLLATRSVSADAGSFSYTGQDATLSAARSVNAEAGAFTYTGQAAELLRNYSFNAEAGTFSIAGQDAELIYTQVRGIDAQAGTYSIAGQDAALSATRTLNAEAGAFSYSGQDVALSRGYNVNAEAGAFTYTGQDANLNFARTLNAETGAFTYTGQNASLQSSRSINAEVGSFDYLGQNASLVTARTLNAESGIFTITGQNASFFVTRALNAEPGAFGEANPYVDPGYVDPYYSTNLTATLGYGRIFNAQVGVFTYTGQDATLIKTSLYPPESDVRAGVVYGPGGIFTGTMPPGSLFIFDD